MRTDHRGLREAAWVTFTICDLTSRVESGNETFRYRRSDVSREQSSQVFNEGCFDAWEEAAFPRLPKLHIPQLQFVIKLRLTEVTTGRASEEERQEQEEYESE